VLAGWGTPNRPLGRDVDGATCRTADGLVNGLRVWEADCPPRGAAPWCSGTAGLDNVIIDPADPVPPTRRTGLGDGYARRPAHRLGLLHLFWNWIGRSQEEIVQARQDWMEGSRFGEVKGYDGAPLPAPELPPVPLKPRGRVR
jgi:hypothetical protein